MITDAVPMPHDLSSFGDFHPYFRSVETVKNISVEKLLFLLFVTACLYVWIASAK